MLQKFISDLATGADDHIKHACGSARLLENLNHSRAREWREGGGFEDNGVPSHQRRSDFPDRDRDRKIPGRNRGNHAEGLLERVCEILWQFARQSFAAHAATLSGHELKNVDGFLDFAQRVFQRFAFFARHQARKFVLLLLHQRRGFRDYTAAHRSRGVAPGRKCRARRGYRLARFFARRERRKANHFVEVGGIPAL